MKLGVSVDFSDALRGWRKYDSLHVDAVKRGFLACSGELLRLSTFEVPHDTGALQASGMADVDFPDGSKYPVGEVSFNTPYAWKVHEHPEYRFQKGRKGKYLEDPAKANLQHWSEIIKAEISSIR